MREWSCDVGVTVHDTEIALVVTGTAVRNDPSVGEPAGWSLEDAHLRWQDETPVEGAMLEIIGYETWKLALTFANEKLLDEGPGEPDPDYLRDLREDAA